MRVSVPCGGVSDFGPGKPLPWRRMTGRQFVSLCIGQRRKEASRYMNALRARPMPQTAADDTTDR